VRIETSRLLLRPISTDDLDDLVALHAEPEVARFMLRLDRDHARERIRLSEREWAERGHGMVGIYDAADERFLGRTGMRWWPQFRETEIGWVLRPEAWGHGYATEAAGACLDWAFANLPDPYFTAMIRPDNERTIGVAAQLGFRRRRNDVLRGETVVVFTIERSFVANHG
jgi:RimJ/RimL family protein N-acetyltransferase